MNHDRLHALTDGIFAIVMTLLVLELKVPELSHVNNGEVWALLRDQAPVFVSYVISFAVLFVYWRAHNFAISILAKNIDIPLLNYNGIFLFLVGLVPFTTHLAGSYSETAIAISVYALNLITIGLCLLFMRIYIEQSDSIEDLKRTAEQRRGALIRIMTPIICATLAIPLSFINTKLGFGILIFGVAYNLHNNAADITNKVFIAPLGRLRRLITS